MHPHPSSDAEIIETGGRPLHLWTRGVPVEDHAIASLGRLAALPFIHHHVAVMPDVHAGLGASIGAVVPMVGAIVPSAVGVDIGCGMMAQRTTLTAGDLPDNLKSMRSRIEACVPHGRTSGGRKGDKGAWRRVPRHVAAAWSSLSGGLESLADRHPALARTNHVTHLGTLGSGNHFIELCLDEADRVWVMLHSGSRGVGGRIGRYFIRLAKEEMRRWYISLPNVDLAYLPEGSAHFDDYVEAVGWAQDYAARNRELMMDAVIDSLRGERSLPGFDLCAVAVNCHHNYVSQETHFGEDVYVTRKGALSARDGELGIIPGSMGARSFIVRGKGNAESFHSCSHGAGRQMSRAAARKRFTVADHTRATAGIECRKDKDVIDETPMAYKPIEAVMAAQSSLVSVVHTLRQVVCVKG